MSFLDENNNAKEVIRSGDPVTIRFFYRATEKVFHPRFGFEIRTDLGSLVTLITNWDTGHEIQSLEGEGHIDLVVSSLYLQPARYYIKIWIKGPETTLIHDVIDDWPALDVEVSNYFGSGRGLHSSQGIIFLPCQWKGDCLIDSNQVLSGG